MFISMATKIYSSASIGEPPQDYSWNNQPGLIEIGPNCIIREYVTIHTPVNGDNGEKTIVSESAFLMVSSHVAHNAKVGDHCILANGCLLGGYVVIDDHAFLSGNVAVHQFCRVGAYAIVGANVKIPQDVPPYTLINGSPPVPHGLNVIGLRRNGFNQETRNKLKDAYKMLYLSGLMKDRLFEIESKYSGDEKVMRLVNFVKASKRGIVGKPGSKSHSGEEV